MEGVLGVYGASSYAACGGAAAGLEVEIGSRRYTGCNGRTRQGSEARSNIAVGHLLVGGDQTWWVCKSQTSVVVVAVVDIVHVAENVNEREEEKLNHTPKRVWGAGAYYTNPLL